ncbi:MAG: regulatory protein RecX, partial [Bacteroidales bacterium]
KQALNKIASLCASSEQSRYDMVEKMRKWELSQEDIDEIVAYLYKENFLDDARYIRVYVRDKSRFNKWGRKKIEFMLAHKGLKGPLVNEILNEELFSEDTLSVLVGLLQNKQRTIKAKDAYDEKAKLFRFAAGRGFGSDDIKRALAKLQLPDEED